MANRPLPYFSKTAHPAFVAFGFVLATFSSAMAEDKVFDELRFGASASIQSGHSREDGVFPEIMALFDPFGFEQATGWKQQLLHPRLHAGSSIGTAGAATQFYGGLTWTVDIGAHVFVEAGFGGTVHTGNLDSGSDGPDTGSRLLFREYLAAGVKLPNSWRVVAQVAHASNANLCDGPNDGMTRAGVLLGYKF